MSMMALDLKILGTSTYLYVLISIVLFFEGYKTMLRVYRKEIYKVIALNLTIIVVSALAIANTSIYSYQKIDKMLLSRNPKVEIPTTHWRETIYNYNRYYLKVFLQDGIINYNVNNNFISLDDLPMFIYSGHFHQQPTIYLLIEKDLSMREVMNVQKRLSSYNLTKVVYVVSDKNQIEDRFDFGGVSKGLPPISLYVNGNSYLTVPPPPPMPKEWLEGIKVVNVEIKNDGSVVVNDFYSKSFNDTYAFFKTQIGQNVLLNFIFDEQQISYQQYIDVYSTYRKAVDELRNSYLKELGHEGIKNYNRGYDSIMRLVKSKYPMRQLDNYVPEQEIRE